MQEITLSTGTSIRCRQVPPHAHIELYSQVTLPVLPEHPTKDVKSVAGNVDKLPIGAGDEGWEEYLETRKAWRVETDRITMEISRRSADFIVDYGVIEWKLSGSDEWQSEAPDDWQFPPALIRHKVAEPSDNKRLDYIYYELLTTESDEVLLAKYVTGQTADLTRGEVKAARGKFWSKRKRRGGRSRVASGDNGAVLHDDISGDEGGKSLASLPRRLVQAIKGE